MARSTRSDSVSSSGSGTASSSSSDAGSSSSSSSAGSSSSLQLGSGKKKQYAFKTPYGFSAVDFGSSSLSEAALASLPASDEIWAVRVPASIPPSELDGLVIKLPPPPSKTAASGTTEPLASLTLPISSSYSNTYHLFPSLSSATKAEESQLISMAATGSLNPSNPSAGNSSALGNAKKASSAGGAVELSSLALLVPQDEGSQRGKMKISRRRIDRHLHFSLASPAETGIGASQKAKNEVKQTVAGEVGAMASATGSGLEKKDHSLGAKANRQQPWDRLKGVFKPAGSYTSSSVIGTKRTAPTPTGTNGDAMEVDAATADVGSASPKKQKREKDDKKKDKKKKKDK